MMQTGKNDILHNKPNSDIDDFYLFLHNTMQR